MDNKAMYMYHPDGRKVLIMCTDFEAGRAEYEGAGFKDHLIKEPPVVEIAEGHLCSRCGNPRHKGFCKKKEA